MPAAYGLQIINPAGELVVSSEGQGLYCIGQCTLQGSVVQPTGTYPSASPGRRSGYSRYRISSPTAPIFALDLPLNKRVGLRTITNLGGNVWEIEVHCGDGADANGFDTVEYQLAVWAFTRHSGTPSGYGLALYNSAGQLSYDFTAGVPLAARAYVEGVSGSYTIPSLTRPLFLGFTPTNVTDEGFNGGNTWRVTTTRGAWVRTSATSIGKVVYTDQKYTYFSPITDPLGLAGGDTYNQPGFILDGSILP